MKIKTVFNWNIFTELNVDSAKYDWQSGSTVKTVETVLTIKVNEDTTFTCQIKFEGVWYDKTMNVDTFGNYKTFLFILLLFILLLVDFFSSVSITQ